MRDYDLICIGCGPAGEKAATQAAHFGHRVSIVEREALPGATMVNTGTIASKALRETALLCAAFRRLSLPGLSYSVNHDMSVTKLMTQRYRVQYQEHGRIESSIDCEQIDIYRGRGRLVDAHTVSVEAIDGQVTTLRAKFILIATGSSPVQPDHIPFDHPCVVDADGILDLTRIPASMVVVGGGVIGCEYACMFHEIGVQVTLIDLRNVLLPFVDPECRDHLLRAMTDEGIEIHLNRSVESVEPPNDESVCARLDDGSTLHCEVLLWAAGRSINTLRIGLEEVKIKTGRCGLLLVNEHYQTNVPNVYAAGDVIGFPAQAATSMEQGRVAACHMFGIDFKKTLADTIPIGLYTIPAVSMVGLNEKQADEAGHEIVVGRSLYRYNVRGRMLGDEQGIVKCVFDRASRRLLGVTIVGEDATELIHIGQFAIIYGAGIDDFINACFNYPSLSELYKYAAHDALKALAAHEDRRQPDHVQAA